MSNSVGFRQMWIDEYKAKTAQSCGKASIEEDLIHHTTMLELNDKWNEETKILRFVTLLRVV